MDWFLYDIGLRHERVNLLMLPTCFVNEDISLQKNN